MRCKTCKGADFMKQWDVGEGVKYAPTWICECGERYQPDQSDALAIAVEGLRRVVGAGRRYQFNVSEVLTSYPPQNPGAYYCLSHASDALEMLKAAGVEVDE